MKKIRWTNLKPVYIVLILSLLAIDLCLSPVSLLYADSPGACRPSELTPVELAIWGSPSFRKQFIQSYIAETEVEPRITESEREQMIKVMELISSDKMENAAELLVKSQNEAASAVFDFTLANIYFQQEKLDLAVQSYGMAVEKYPKFRRAWRNLGLIYVRQSQFEEAMSALAHVIELGGGDALTFGLLGFTYASLNNHVNAESAYRMATMLDPLTLDWKMGLARSLFKQERYAEAVVFCGSLITEKPDRADLWLLQANAYIGLNQPLKAVENYEFVDRMGQATADSLNMSADIYTNAEMFDMAADAYLRALEKDADSSPTRALRAAKVMIVRGGYKQTHDLLDGIEKLRKDRMKDEDRKDVLKLRARLAVAEGAGDQEAGVLEEIVALDPMDGEALILLGQHYARKADSDKAIFYFERAAGIEKYEADAKVRHAQLLVGQGKYEEALPLLRRAQQVKPRDDVQKYLNQVEQVARSK